MGWPPEEAWNQDTTILRIDIPIIEITLKGRDGVSGLDAD
jgi:hypothetical protein